jgi:hypothetical protein
MLGYRKHSFAQAHLLLSRLRDNLEDLEALRELQELLLREVVRTEKKIRQHKSEIRAIAEPNLASSAKRLRYLNRRIEGYRQCAYVWRSFGDAIAFIYVDRFSLKQCFYSTETINPKQDAGFILGKEGLANELAILNAALERDIPAILVDLTNTIRHGDVCLLGASDPFLIEAKVGKNLNSRGKKQKRNLEKLHDFYETDKSLGLRGIPVLQRRANIDADAGETSSPSLASDSKGPTSDDEDTDESYSQKAYDVAVPVMRERLEIMGFSDAVWREELQEYVDRKIAYRVKFVERSEPGTPERTLAERTLAIVQGSSLQRWMKKWLQLVDHAVNQNYTVPEDTLMHEMSDKHVQLEPIFTRELIALRGALEVLEDDHFVTFDFTNAVYQEEIVTAHDPPCMLRIKA